MRLFIADVDGVFTDDRAHPSKEAIILSAMIGSSEPFAYVTGRSASWLLDQVAPALENVYRVHQPRFSLLCAEYGAVTLRYAKGKWTKAIDPMIVGLAKMRNTLRGQIADVPGVFFDESKEVMITVEARHDMRDVAHGVVEEGLREAERLLLAAAANDPLLEYQRTTYACDLSPRGLNKSFGARMVLTALGSIPDEAILIGDAPSDFLLTDPFIAQGIPYTMCYVGDEAKITARERAYVLRLSAAKYDKGTIEILKRFR